MTEPARAPQATAPTYSLELVTVARPGAAEFVARVARVLETFPQHAPTRVGARDPARTTVSDLPGQLVELATRQADRPQAVVHLAAPHGGGTGTVSYVADPFRRHPPGFVRPSKVELLLAPRSPGDLGELLARLAEAIEASYGFLAQVEHVHQQRGRFLADRVGRHGPSPAGGAPPAWRPPPFQALEMHLPDVFWVQVFGPAFVARWGADRLERAGARRRVLSHGGYVVWATEEPPPFDEGAATPEAYAWKHSVYEAIGAQPFLRADRGWNGFGEHVPLMTEHRAHLCAERLGQPGR
ncbi:hypothetical protein [Cumulibacter manganitolerans]|uniref:hypothetical protein n=1 Tax=Cumulibacter manganitolerans TaxID=1884992 RepID=UPI001297A0C8|nr:hypothetical protein [Cumulibacter manganitolerans]